MTHPSMFHTWVQAVMDARVAVPDVASIEAQAERRRQEDEGYVSWTGVNIEHNLDKCWASKKPFDETIHGTISSEAACNVEAASDFGLCAEHHQLVVGVMLQEPAA